MNWPRPFWRHWYEQVSALRQQKNRAERSQQAPETGNASRATARHGSWIGAHGLETFIHVAGGIGGGGLGGVAGKTGTDGTTGTGGGGGGGGGNSGATQQLGGAGGSGILILKHSATQPTRAVFYSSGTFTAQSATVNYLVVGGGGGGGNNGGGGGAGGFRTGSGYSVTPGQTYPITVGAGGTGSQGNVHGGSGGNSTGFSQTAIGGGGGGQTRRMNIGKT